MHKRLDSLSPATARDYSKLSEKLSVPHSIQHKTPPQSPAVAPPLGFLHSPPAPAYRFQAATRQYSAAPQMMIPNRLRPQPLTEDPTLANSVPVRLVPGQEPSRH